jgi:voltage-gated potassium channel
LGAAVWLVAIAILLGVFGFMYFEKYTVLEAFYMTIITLSTVGYQEVRPISNQGKIFVSMLILFNVFVFTYGASAFTYFVIQGEYFRNLYIKRNIKRVSKLKNHMIICGYGRYGTEVADYFYKHNTPFVILETDHERIEAIINSDLNLYYIEDDATKDAVLLKAGLLHAHAIICALPDDSDNLYTVLSARQLNPDISIISRAHNSRSKKKLQLAGANHVIMPEQIGGYYMANLVSKPNATEFFSFISDEIEHDIGFEEVAFDSIPEKNRFKSIAELRIREETGANVIGYRSPSGKYVVNPPPDVKLEDKASFIVLGNSDQLENLRKYLSL